MKVTDYEYIEFTIRDKNKFDDFIKLYKLISEAKNSDDYKSDEFWFNKFPNHALKQYHFSKTDLKPKFETAKLVGGTWHFYTMIDYLLESLDVELGNCRAKDDKKGKLNFCAKNYPYGGITGLIMLLNSFDCKATNIDEGGGIYNVIWKSETEFELKSINK